MNALIFGCIRDSFPSWQVFHKRSDAIAILKTSQVVCTALSLASFGLACLKAHEGSLFPTVAFLSASYAFFEMKTVSDNTLEILESPTKEFRAILAKLHSYEKLWLKVSKGAPLARKLGLIYFGDEAIPIEPKPEPSLISKIFCRK